VVMPRSVTPEYAARSISIGAAPPAPGPWPTVGRWPILRSREVHLWWWNLSSVWGHPDPREVLSEAELARAARLRPYDIQRRWVVGRIWLRTVLARYLGCNPAALVFRYGAGGKPHLDGPFSGLGFNLSHSGDHALLAVAETSLGIDIEEIGSEPPPADLLEEVFGIREVRVFHAAREDRRASLFARGWTRKEALLKVFGEGLSRAPSTVVALEDGGIVRCNVPFEICGDGDGFRHCTLWDLEPLPGVLGAVALKEMAPIFRTWTWVPG